MQGQFVDLKGEEATINENVSNQNTISLALAKKRLLRVKSVTE